jgi:hypothetical protein
MLSSLLFTLLFAVVMKTAVTASTADLGSGALNSTCYMLAVTGLWPLFLPANVNMLVNEAEDV